MNVLRTLRNHWKKTVFFSGAVFYGLRYSKEKYEIGEIMKLCCQEAVKYGEVTIDPIIPPKKLIVLLNPAADKRSSEKNYKNFCEPILQLAGYLVEVVQTESAGHARRYVEEELTQLPDGIIIAGGDGTVSETITGLLRRSDKQLCPIGVLPLGRTNEIAVKTFAWKQKNYVDEVRLIANTAMAVVRGKVEQKDVIKVQPLVEPDTSEEDDVNTEIQPPPKPVYAMASLQWGAFRDLKNLRDKYWYFGPLREYAAPLFNAFGDRLTWECKTKLIYTPPCSGCSNCRTKVQQQTTNKRWWSGFVPRFKLGQQVTEKDYSKIVNAACNTQNELEIKPCEIILELDQDNNSNSSKLTMKVKDEVDSGFDFISQSWNRVRTKQIDDRKLFEGRTVTLLPQGEEDPKKFYFIDNEAFEVRPVQLSIVPQAVKMYVL